MKLSIWKIYSHLNSRFTPLALALVVIAYTAQPIWATTITFSDRPNYESTLDTIVIDDYEDPNYEYIQTDIEMSAVVGETSYKSTGFTDLNFVPSDYYCTGCNSSYEMNFTGTSVSEGNGVFGVGFDFFNSDTPTYNAYVTFGDNSIMDIQLPVAEFSNRQFFGITSDKLIKTMHLGLAGGVSTIDGSFGQDNLTIGTQVPEPTAVLLIAIGIAGAITTSRRH